MSDLPVELCSAGSFTLRTFRRLLKRRHLSRHDRGDVHGLNKDQRLRNFHGCWRVEGWNQPQRYHKHTDHIVNVLTLGHLGMLAQLIDLFLDGRLRYLHGNLDDLWASPPPLT